MTKTRQDNDLIDRIGLVYVKNDNELSGLIRSDVVYDKTRQDKDLTNHIGMVYAENDYELLGLIRSGTVFDEIRKDNDVTDLPHVIYIENETELLWLIELGAIYHENQTDQRHDWLYKCGQHRKRYWAIVTDQTGSSLWRKLEKTTMWLII